MRFLPFAVVVLGLAAAGSARAQEEPPIPDAPVPAPVPAAPEQDLRGFQLGARAGYGRALQTSHAVTFDAPSVLPIAFDAGYRTSNHFYFGLGAQLALASRTDCPSSGPCSAKDYRFTGGFQYHAKPLASVDPWLGAGIGYEIMHLSGFPADTGGHLTRKGLVMLDLQLGLDFALGAGPSHPKIGPFLGLALGTMLSETGRVYGVDISRSSALNADYQWLTLGVRATFDL